MEEVNARSGPPGIDRPVINLWVPADSGQKCPRKFLRGLDAEPAPADLEPDSTKVLLATESY